VQAQLCLLLIARAEFSLLLLNEARVAGQKLRLALGGMVVSTKGIDFREPRRAL